MDMTCSSIVLDLTANEYLQKKLLNWDLLKVVKRSSNQFYIYDGDVITFNVQDNCKYYDLEQNPGEDFRLKGTRCLRDFFSKQKCEVFCLAFQDGKFQENNLGRIQEFFESLKDENFIFLTLRVATYNN